MKDTVFKKRVGDVERAIEKVDPANNGFTGTGLAEYLNSPYDGPPSTKQGTRSRKLNSRGQWATGTSVSNILRRTHYPYVEKKKRRAYFHLGTDTEKMQKEHDDQKERLKNKPRMEDYIEPFIRYWKDDDYGLEDVATEMGVSVPTISVKFRRLEESSTYGHYPVQYKERTGRKRKVTARKKKKPPIEPEKKAEAPKSEVKKKPPQLERKSDPRPGKQVFVRNLTDKEKARLDQLKDDEDEHLRVRVQTILLSAQGERLYHIGLKLKIAPQKASDIVQTFNSKGLGAVLVIKNPDRRIRAKPLTESDLELVQNMPKNRQAVVQQRLRIIQLSGEGYTVKEVANKAGVSYPTASKWIHIFNEQGMKAVCSAQGGYRGYHKPETPPTPKQNVETRLSSLETDLAEIKSMLSQLLERKTDDG